MNIHWEPVEPLLIHEFDGHPAFLNSAPECRHRKSESGGSQENR